MTPLRQPFRVDANGGEIIDRGNGVVTHLLVGRHNGATITTGTTTLLAGQSAPWHSHNCDEQIMLLTGKARVEYDDGAFDVGPFDTSFIPAGISHRFVNTGEGPMVMYFIYDRADVTRTFTQTGATVAHLSSEDNYR